MRSERLLRLLMILQAAGRISVKQLSRRLEVSARTVQRDLEALCLAGIPLYAERGQGGGWQLSEGYRTSLTGMNRRELLSLLLGGEAIAGDLNLEGSLQSAREKLFASVPAPYRQALHEFQERMHVDGAGWFSSGEEIAFLAPLQEAVFSGKQILARYGSSEERILHPLGLVIKGQADGISLPCTKRRCAAIEPPDSRTFGFCRMTCRGRQALTWHLTGRPR